MILVKTMAEHLYGMLLAFGNSVVKVRLDTSLGIIMTDINKIDLAGTKAKGNRPYFLNDKQTEQVMSITMAVAMELSVTRERVATLECLLTEKGVLTRDEIESYKPDSAEVAARSLSTQEYLARILRILQQDKEEQLSEDDPSIESAQQELTRP